MKTRSGKEYHCQTINNHLYRKGPAKLHVFGKGNYDTFKLNHLKSEDIKRMKLMFKDKIEQAKQDGWYDSGHYISYKELYEYVDDRVKTDNNILIGDIIYEANEYETRPEYGFHIVSYDPEKKCKIYRFNEGMPLIKEKQIVQLKKNNVTYDDINKYSKQLPDFDYWEGFYYSWVEHGIYEGLMMSLS